MSVADTRPIIILVYICCFKFQFSPGMHPEIFTERDDSEALYHLRLHLKTTLQTCHKYKTAPFATAFIYI
jgi:hypothetical protein